MNKYIISVRNTANGEYENVEVTEEVYRAYMRTGWNIKDNDESFFKHQIQFSALLGNIDDAVENFKEFPVFTHSFSPPYIYIFCQNSFFKHFFSCLSENIIDILGLSIKMFELFLNKIFYLTLYLTRHIFYTFLCLPNVFHSVLETFFSFHPNYFYLSKYHSPLFYITLIVLPNIKSEFFRLVILINGIALVNFVQPEV